MKTWHRVIDVVTGMWVVVFVLTAAGVEIPGLSLFGALIGAVYVADLVVLWRRCSGVRDFFGRAWLDLLLLIPFLRLFRCGRLARVIARNRRLSRVIRSRVLDSGVEGIDLVQKGIERIRINTVR